jgi:putative toxin-antitoxin system antitoxin component (TIGR02293 family)
LGGEKGRRLEYGAYSIGVDVAVEALNLLGAGTYFQTREKSSREFWRQIQSGLPTESFELVVKRVPTSNRSRWRKLVATQAPGAKLSPDDSEKAGRLAFVLALAKDVWGDWSRATEFLQRPHPELDGKSPLEAAESEWGAREVENLLRKIQFGLPA